VNGFLDKLPPALRHAVLVAAGICVTALIQWVQTDYTNWGLPPQVVALLGFAIPMALNYLTPWLTTQYGVGSSAYSPVLVDFTPVVNAPVDPQVTEVPPTGTGA
jgi:hypothetical protein